jgi:hypothetical protein
MCHSTRRRLHCAPRCVVKSKLIDRMRGSGNPVVLTVVLVTGAKPADLLAMKNASMIYGQMQKAH